MFKAKATVHILLAFYCFTSLTACTSIYRSPDLPTGGKDKIAVVEHEDRILQAFTITKIDGQRRIGWFRRLELTPGRHSISAVPNLGSSGYGYEITRYFTASAGTKYSFVGSINYDTMRWSFSIEEIESRRSVDSAY